MTTIRSVCSNCSESVDIPSNDVVLFLTADRRAYEFFCPKCGKISSKKVDDKITTLLIATEGVKIVRDESTTDPEVYPETKNVKNVLGEAFPAIELDDLIDFHLHLDDEIEALLQ